MIRARIQIALVGLLVLGFFPFACHRTAPVQRNPDVRRVVKDTAGVGPVVKDKAGVVPLLEDTALVSVSFAGARNFKLRNPGQRDSLRATLRKERALWRARSPRDYQFMLRVQCFCPGTLGWLLMEVRRGEPLRAWDTAGKSVALTNWNTFSIDGLFDNLERKVDVDGEVQVGFDPRWYFPAYVSTITLPGPDTWGIIEARGLRPI